jgi:hypothetical protein
MILVAAGPFISLLPAATPLAIPAIQSYIYIMQVIRSLSFSGMPTFAEATAGAVFRLPITGIMYFGLRQIAALPTRWTREPKPQKNKAKVCKLRAGRPAVKKQGQDKSR